MVIQHKMNAEAEETLKVLREIGANPQLTQRELSSRLSVSLGKINFIIQTMIEEGLIKVENFKKHNNKSAYLYIITPKGIEEKAKKTSQFLRNKVEKYEELGKEINQLKKEVSFSDPQPDKGRKVIL